VTDTLPHGADAADTDDVVELILADHREFERLFRALRNREEDRAARRAELADLLVAHAEAEEREVYPNLERHAPEAEDEIEHSHEEHSEGHEKLLDLLRVEDVDSEGFEEALEELVETVTHHLDEEERDVLNAARENVPDERSAGSGASSSKARPARSTTSPGWCRRPRNAASCRPATAVAWN
jgi:hemerythrin superfamily protein